MCWQCLHARCIGRPESYPLTADLRLDLTCFEHRARHFAQCSRVFGSLHASARRGRSRGTGAPWHDLPERYGADTTAYNRFNRWAKKGIWLRIFETLGKEHENVEAGVQRYRPTRLTC